MDSSKVLLAEYEYALQHFMAVKRAMMITAEFKLGISKQALEKMFDEVDARILTATIKAEPLVESIVKEYFAKENKHGN